MAEQEQQDDFDFDSMLESCASDLNTKLTSPTDAPTASAENQEASDYGSLPTSTASIPQMQPQGPAPLSTTQDQNDAATGTEIAPGTGTGSNEE